jgi:hypothetical protein
MDPPSQQIIKCLCEANACFPNSYHISIALSTSFVLRFILTQSNEDYEHAMVPLDRIITSYSLAESPNQDLIVALAAAANLAHGQFILFGTLEYL